MILSLFIFLFLQKINCLDNDDIDNDDETHQISWDEVPIQEVIIIGSGPAGSTAGIYLGRSGHKPLILHGQYAGGQLMMTSEVENFPTFKGTGTELSRAIHSQAQQSGAIFIEDEIASANLTSNPKRLIGFNGEKYRSKAVIIATGAKARYLGIQNEQKYLNRGVSACATCDGPLYKNQKVAVVGGGDSGVTEALILSKICSNVTLIHRSANLTASLPMRKKLSESNVTVIRRHTVVDVIGDEYVTGIQIKNVDTDEFFVLSVSALFVAIGRIPETSVFADEVGVDKQKYFVKRPSIYGESTATKIPGVFVAGDCADPVYRQAITSAGSGCQAALDVERYLNRIESEE